MVRAQLSPEVIEQLEFLPRGNSFQVWWDKTLPGFGVRIYPSGAKSFVCKYRKDGVQCVDTLGSISLLSLDQAREAARTMLLEACQYQKRAQSAEEPQIPEFCAEYIQRFAKVHRAQWMDEQQICQTYICPKWENRTVSSIGSSDVELLVNTVSIREPQMAMRIRSQIAAMWDCAKFWNYVAEESPNPADGLRDLTEAEAEYWLQDYYAERFWDALESEQNFFVKAAILFLLLSGLRKMECVQAKWQDVNFESKTILVRRASKGNIRTFKMPLNPAAIALLEVLPKCSSNEYLFPGKQRGLPIEGLDERWERLRVRVGIEQTKLQGLRAAVAAALAVDGEIVQRVKKALGYRL